jgi:Transposase
VLSIVDNRAFRRLAFRVLEHDPDQQDMRSFLADFKAQLDLRTLVVRGITTDGSSLYPKVLKELWPEAAHQICVFHVVKEITKAILRALAKLRKELAKQIRKLPRGRPRQDKESRAKTRKVKRLKERLAELFEHRYLFVRRRLSKAQQKVLARLLRGRPQLRALRQIMTEVYQLFDRRCRTATALKKLAKLRARVRRFKQLGKALDKLKSPTLDKALLFLDDELLGSTSNAVERGNRRFRKAQRSVYSVRTAQQLRRRLALDLHREQRAARRAQTLKFLHSARSGHDSQPP